MSQTVPFPPTRALRYVTCVTPIGELLLVVRDVSIVRVTWISSETTLADELNTLSERFALPVEEDSIGLHDIVQQVDEYFSGERTDFALSIDLALVSGFQREVLEQVRTIPYGETASYRELAIMAGSPNAYRAAGTACGQNPVLLLIPCHRIIKADGTIGSYGDAGVDTKAALLKLEQKYLP